MNNALATPSVRVLTLTLILSLVFAATIWADHPVGDADGNCTVDIKDLLILSDNWLDGTCSETNCGDMGGEDGVNMVDFGLMAQNWHVTTAPLVITEYMADNETTIADGDGNYRDWIEIYNPTDDTISLDGWYLTDDLGDTGHWWPFPSDAVIGDHDYLLVFASGASPGYVDSLGYMHTTFALNNEGEYLGLIAADGVTIACEYTELLGQYDDVSYGLTAGMSQRGYFWPATPGQPNPAETSGDPTRQVVINEIMYHPSSENILEEYIELYNLSAESVDMSGWAFSNGVAFVFPEATIVASGAYLVVAAEVATFSAKYPGVTNVIGGWDGRLSNKSEEIELDDAMGTRVDRVTYADQGHWAQRELGPVEFQHRGWQWSDAHDGGGKSLELINPVLSNQYGQNWAASLVDQGTPGAANSVADTDIAPMILEVEHLPIIPHSSDTVTVTVQLMDELTTGLTAALYYRPDQSTYTQGVYPHNAPNAFTSVTMYDDGVHGDGAAGDGVYGVEIPAQADATIVEFYVKASDSGANWRTWPAPSDIDGSPEQVTNMLYQVDDSFDPSAQWAPGSRPIFYIIMTEGDRAELEDIGDDGDPWTGEGATNAQMNGMFVSLDGTDMKVRYNVGVRNRGNRTRVDPPNNYHIDFRNDDPWKDITALNINSKYAFLQTLGSLMFRISGLAAPEVELVEVRVNGQNLALDDPSVMYGSYAALEAFNNEWAENHYPDDPDGNLYRCTYYQNNVDPMTYADLIFINPGSPPDPSDYHENYPKQTNEEDDDYTDLFTLIGALNDNALPDDEFYDQLSQIANIEQFVRYMAVDSLIGNSEGGLITGDGDDYAMYCGVNDPRFVLLPHDLDTILGQGEYWLGYSWDIFRYANVEGLELMLNNPRVIQMYFTELMDLIETVFAPENFDPLVEEVLDGFVPGSTIDAIKDYMVNRINANGAVLDQIPHDDLTVSSSFPESGGFPRTTSGSLSLNGTANAVITRSLRVNGQLVPETNWSQRYGTWSFVSSSSGSGEIILPRGSTWKYLDDGSNQGTAANGVNWFGHPDYDDSTWAAGPAELGYGDTEDGPGGVAPGGTPVGYIDTDPITGGVQKNITTYFRRSFTIPVGEAEGYTDATIRLVSDDGAVIYINGVEAFRTNFDPALDGTAILYDTTAYIAVSGDPEEIFYSYPIDAGLLQDGENVIAVEIHQVNSSSSDISFDLELEGLSGESVLKPGINRIIVQAFDGPDGTGNEVDRGHIDIWYDTGYTNDVSGVLSASAIWTAADGPYHVTGEVTVPANLTLQIMPGTSVYFDADTQITVNGIIDVQGTEYQRIRFTGVPGAPLVADIRPELPDGPPKWGGIQLQNTMSDQNIISYADVEYAQNSSGSIGVNNSEVVIDNVSFSGTRLRMVYSDSASVIIRNSIFADMFEPSDSPLNMTPPLDNVSEHIKHVGYIPTGGHYIIENNIFGTNKGHNDVIDFDSGQQPDPILQILNNTFIGGGDEAIDGGGDMLIEGNLFANFIKDIDNDGTGDSNVISTSDMLSSTMVIARNVFVNNDHVVNFKLDGYGYFENNTVTGITAPHMSLPTDTPVRMLDFSAINFLIPNISDPENGVPRDPAGKGAYTGGNIFDNIPQTVFGHPDMNPTYGGIISNLEVKDCLVESADVFANADGVHGRNFDYLIGEAHFAGPDTGNYEVAYGSALGSNGNGQDMGAMVSRGASISGEPQGVTNSTGATLTIGGPGIFSFIYRVNDEPWSSEIEIWNPLNIDATEKIRSYDVELTGLTDGDYTVYVRGRNFAGEMQTEPTASDTWTVDTSYQRLVINEVLAYPDLDDPDLIELYYEGPGVLDLTDMSITDDPANPRQYVFTATSVAPGEYLVLYADTDTVEPGVHLGFALDNDGEGVYLYDTIAAGGGLIDSVEFGLQLKGFSIGRVAGGGWHLTVPTPGIANIIHAVGDPRMLKINEWLADEEVLFTDDFIEIYNPNLLPVDMGGLFLTDNLISQQDKFKLAPLSFAAGQGYAVFKADDSNNAGHVDFKLSTRQEMIGLFDEQGNEIDKVIYYGQTTDVSQGRAPDGSDTLAFFTLPTPGVTNTQIETTIETITLIAEGAEKKVLVPTSGDNAIIGDTWRNGQPFDDSGWTHGTPTIPGTLGGVGYDEATDYDLYITYNVESRMNNINATCYIRIPFVVDADDLADFTSLEFSARCDDGFVAFINGVEVAEINKPGSLTWNSSCVNRPDSTAFVGFDVSDHIGDLVAGDNILAIHALNQSAGSSDFLISVKLSGSITTTVVEDPFADDRDVLAGLRITEIMYHPILDDDYEFIELRNIGAGTLDLTGVRFTDSIGFTFPSDTTMPAGTYLVLAKDPVLFELEYPSVPGGIIYGPYDGQLSNGGENVVLQLATPLQAAILRFDYEDDWYPTTDGGGYSLVIRDATAAPATWDSKTNWQAGSSPGGSPGTAD